MTRLHDLLNARLAGRRWGFSIPPTILEHVRAHHIMIRPAGPSSAESKTHNAAAFAVQAYLDGMRKEQPTDLDPPVAYVMPPVLRKVLERKLRDEQDG